MTLKGCTTKANCAAAPATTSKETLDSTGKAPEEATSVYPTPPLSNESPANVATPLTALTVGTPESTLPPGLLPSASPTLAVEAVSTLPNASSTATWTSGAKTDPAATLAGWTRKASFATAATPMSKGPLVAPTSPGEEAASVYPTPTLSTARPAYEATPPTAAPAPPPVRVPPPGLAPSANPTLAAEEGSRLPSASSTATWTTGDSATPARLLAG